MRCFSLEITVKKRNNDKFIKLEGFRKIMIIICNTTISSLHWSLKHTIINKQPHIRISYEVIDSFSNIILITYNTIFLHFAFSFCIKVDSSKRTTFTQVHSLPAKNMDWKHIKAAFSMGHFLMCTIAVCISNSYTFFASPLNIDYNRLVNYVTSDIYGEVS